MMAINLRDDIAKALKERFATESSKELAKEFGVSSGYISKAARMLGLKKDKSYIEKWHRKAAHKSMTKNED